jgi:carbon storage regulator CsrA
MLVLSRRPGESIVINGNIRITVVETKPGHIRLGIDAPPNVPVDRLEVHKRRKQFNEFLEERMRALVAVSANGANARCHAN